MIPDDAAARLRQAAALRALCLRLPHVPTPKELQALERFAALVAAPEHATAPDVDALAAGWSSWWREGRMTNLAAMALRVPRELIEGDRRLASYAEAARLAGLR